MATTTNISVRTQGGWSVANSATGGRFGLRFGTDYRSTLKITVATQVYAIDFSLAAAASLSIDLTGGTGETDVENAALDLESVLLLHVELDSVGAGKSVEVGPLAAANGWVGPFKHASGGAVVQDRLTIACQSDPVVVDATHKILKLTNPGAGTVTGKLLVFGVAA